jgi:hypothetical protein
VEYRGTTFGDTGNILLDTPDPAPQVADYNMAALRRAGCRPVRTDSPAGGTTLIRGVVPATGKALNLSIAVSRGATRVALQYGMY